MKSVAPTFRAVSRHFSPWFFLAMALWTYCSVAVPRENACGQEAAPPGPPGNPPWITVSPDGTHFVEKETGRRFVPWGFNYDHDEAGRLLEDYWLNEWCKVLEDFREMRELGANVVRIHLQFGKFMESVDKPRAEQLAQLRRLLDLAASQRIYLDITGLGCYHKQDVPEWYDRLSESDRWRAQANFWRAVTEVCAEHPAVFCYDLMNEPVVPGGDQPRTDWLGPPFGDKHFVQFISLDRAGRERPEIARRWIRTLTLAIREQDKKHLITVGLVPWSLDRPGLTSGFVPQVIAPELDFIAVHIYPERGKLNEALDTLAGFAVGKPLVIEEIFPLACSTHELEQFLGRSSKWACGWIGFYWGKTVEECRRSPTIADQITASWLELFRKGPPVTSPN